MGRAVIYARAIPLPNASHGLAHGAGERSLGDDLHIDLAPVALVIVSRGGRHGHELVTGRAASTAAGSKWFAFVIGWISPHPGA